MMMSTLLHRFGLRGIAQETARVVPRVAAAQRHLSCPVTGDGAATAGPGITVASSTAQQTRLVEVPSLPLFGSTIPRHSGVPPMGDGEVFDFWVGMREKFGDFYKVGLPGFGVGLHGTAHVLVDPKEMAKVIRNEGKFPSGIAQNSWALRKLFNEYDSPLTRGGQDGLFGRSTDWRRQRTFMQTDLLSPKAADGYIPGVIEAAEIASKGAPAMSGDLNNFMNHCAFDMFCTIMFGQLVETADPRTPTDPENLEFVEAAKVQLGENNNLNRKPFEVAMGKLGIKTNTYKKVEKAFLATERISRGKIAEFVVKKRAARLNELEEKSWLAHAIDRQASGESGVSEEEALAMASAMLTAGVDTTAGLMTWHLLHAAVHGDIQERLHRELSAAVEETDGRLTPNVLRKSATPFLHAFIRETHRLTPTAPINVFKKVASEIEIHGRTFPEGTFFMFDGFSTGRDPNIVDDPETFRPERWLPEAVAARKGTPSEIIDNQFFKEPFSQGARKCPGSRVASNEAHAFLAQLVLDWRISAPSVDSYKDVPYRLRTSVTPDLPVMEFASRS